MVSPQQKFKAMVVSEAGDKKFTREITQRSLSDFSSEFFITILAHYHRFEFLLGTHNH